MRRVSGFTLVELIVVISILAILAATAIPRFVDLTGNARTAAMNGVVGAAVSGAAVNYAAELANNSGAVVLNTCANLGTVMQGGTPAGATFTGTNTPTADGDTLACTITYIASGGTVTTTFNAIAVFAT